MVNWNCVIDKNKSAVKAFATGKMSLRSLMEKSSNEARRELRHIERGYGAQYGRRLARKALRRRGALA